MRWTISRQVLCGYAASIFIILVLGVLAAWVSGGMLKAFEERRQANLVISKADNALAFLLDAETGQRGYIITGADSYLAPYTNAVAQLPAALNELTKAVESSGSDTSHIAELRTRVADKLDELNDTIKLRSASGLEAAAAVVASDRGKKDMDRIRAILEELKAAEVQEMEASNAVAQAGAGVFRRVLFIGAPICILVMLTIGIVTARSIANPINGMAGAAAQISAGNLNVEIPQRGSAEEVRLLAASFANMIGALKQSARLSERIAAGDLTVEISPTSEMDTVGRSQADMVSKLSGLIEQVQRSGVQVNSSAVQIAATGKQQQSTAAEMASTTTEISTTAKQMSATSSELLKVADSVNAVSQQLSELAGSGKDGLSRMEEIMRQILDASASITARLAEMNEKAGNISSVVTTITKVADQTNLLSLNAAIEAEKAGEYGRGFSVVASEIRRLADQTAASTLDIEQMVKEMLGSVSAGVMGMDKFSEEVRRSAKEMGDVSGQVDQVIEQAKSLAPSIESLYEGMRAQTQGASQISDALSQLGEAARQTADAVRDSNRAVDQLNEATRGLQTAISRFKLN